eukprot:351879-Chlamydomonas_euryale.AAC.23
MLPTLSLCTSLRSPQHSRQGICSLPGTDIARLRKRNRETNSLATHSFNRPAASATAAAFLGECVAA